MTGILYGVSVGTGDPELITLKGLRIIQNSPVVAFPAGSNGQLGMAAQIVLPWLNFQQQQLALHFPYVQDEVVMQQAWQVAAEGVWDYLKQGQDVAFACEGDVSFYSTFTYLAETLQAIHPEAIIKRIPGVSSPMAAAAALGLPLTVRNQGFVVLPALYSLDDLEAVLPWADVVVLLKVSSVYEQVWQVLQRHQLLEHSYIVERATLPNQVIYKNLTDFPHLKLPYFSLLIVQVYRDLFICSNSQ
jgi:precorrin-2/cobalt-factor-2 C20-methyltransferase